MFQPAIDLGHTFSISLVMRGAKTRAPVQTRITTDGVRRDLHPARRLLSGMLYVLAGKNFPIKRQSWYVCKETKPRFQTTCHLSDSNHQSLRHTIFYIHRLCRQRRQECHHMSMPLLLIPIPLPPLQARYSIRNGLWSCYTKADCDYIFCGPITDKLARPL